jgi:hypothetical protein
MTIPADIPERIDIPAAWIGPDMAAHVERWRWSLSREELGELEATARGFLSTYGGDLTQLSPDRFALPTLEPKLRRLRETLIHGIGFEVIRGIPVHNVSEELASTMFCGLGSHLGSARSQNAKGDLLGHVRDVGADSRDPNVRIYQTHERQTLRTDSSDVVGLLCLNEAREGGDSLLVSAVTMFDRLANDPRLDFTMRLEPGDMQFVYNHSLLHDRTAFVDWPEPEPLSAPDRVLHCSAAPWRRRVAVRLTRPGLSPVEVALGRSTPDRRPAPLSLGPGV